MYSVEPSTSESPQFKMALASACTTYANFVSRSDAAVLAHGNCETAGVGGGGGGGGGGMLARWLEPELWYANHGGNWVLWVAGRQHQGWDTAPSRDDVQLGGGATSSSWLVGMATNVHVRRRQDSPSACHCNLARG